MSETDLFKEKHMDAKTQGPLFKEEHVGMTFTVKPKAVSPERAKFVALAKKRMNRAIKAIRDVGKLDRKQRHYEYNDACAMATALGEEVQWARERLCGAVEPEPNFQFDADGEE